MRIIFVGTPNIAVNTYNSLKSTHDIVAVLTQTDKPIGRSKKLVPSAIAVLAESDKIPVYKAERITDELISDLTAYNADIFVTFAFGVILPQKFLDMTKYGGINIHPSLLPKLRGASPIQTAILQGEEMGITVQKIRLKVDSGEILKQVPIKRDISDNLEYNINDIEEIISRKSAEIIVDVMSDIENNYKIATIQDESKATYCRMIKKEDGFINWEESGRSIINKIRAFAKWPITYGYIDGERINIYKAKLIDNAELIKKFMNETNGQIVNMDNINGILVKASDSLIKITSIQLRGKNILSDKDFMNGGKRFLNKIFIKEEIV